MRRPDWEQRLLAWADAQIGQPFAWGVTDCHALALRAFEAMHGCFPDQIPEWSSEREALALLVSGWGPLEALPRLGAVPIPHDYWQRGDVIVEPAKGGGIAGVLVVLGDGRFLTSHPGDVVHWVERAELDPAVSCWRWPRHG